MRECLKNDVRRFPSRIKTARDDYLRYGYCILRVSQASMRRPAEALLRVCRHLGRVLDQDASGTLIKRVEDRGTAIGEGASSRYSESKAGRNFHTDGVERDGVIPRYFALLCVRQARLGGGLVLIDGARVLAKMEKVPSLTETLESHFPFDRRGDHGLGKSPVVFKPILDRADGNLSVNYLRKYIEASQQHEGIPPLAAAQVDALDALDAVLEDPAVQIPLHLEPADLIVVDNRRFFHGRTAFWDPDSGPKRLLLRAWIG